MAVVIIEPSAVSYDRTHSFQGLIAHTKVLLKNNQDVIWMINRNSKVSQDVKAIYPVFDYSIYDEIGKQGGFIRKLKIIIRRRYLVRTTLEKISKIFKEINLGGKDHILIPVTDWIIFSVIVKWMKNLRQGEIPNIHFLLMYENAPWMIGGYPYNRIIAKLKGLGRVRNRIYLYTETNRHAENLRKNELGVRVDVCPFPIVLDNHGQEELEVKGKIIISLVGGGRRDKGFSAMYEIIKMFQDLYKGNSEIEFIMQYPREMDKLENDTRRIESLEKVRMLNNRLSQVEYEDYIYQSDIMIFPYHKDTYTSRGSGIVCQAVAAGKPIVVTKSTALAERITHKNGLSASVGNEFSQAILEVVSNLDTFRKNARLASDHYNDSSLNNAIVKNIKQAS